LVREVVWLKKAIREGISRESILNRWKMRNSYI
jgi:hypothetical protein